MERLTYIKCPHRWSNGRNPTPYSTKETLQVVCNKLGKIEDILGDDYDLDRLRELVEADRDGRCVVLPVRGYTDKDGEQALNSAMNTCFYHNNPVTRYIADAVAEKLTREAAEAALKGDPVGQESKPGVPADEATPEKWKWLMGRFLRGERNG